MSNVVNTGFEAIRNHPIRSAIAIGTLGAISAFGAYGPEGFGADGPTQAGAVGVDISAGGNAAEAVAVTDAVLQKLDRNVYNCGGHLQTESNDGKYSVDYAINYYNSNPDLAKPMVDFHNSTLGEDAVNSLIANGITNADTTSTEHFTGASEVQQEVDTLLHKRSRVSLNTERVYANYSCITGDGEFKIHRATRKPTIAIGKDSHVEGIRVNDAGLIDFISKVKKNEDGQVPVDVIDLGPQAVMVNGQLTVEHQSLVVLYADGCDNPILKLTTPKISSPRHPGSTSTTTTPEFVPEKHDDGKLPGDGTPASQDPGTPDKPGKGPAGQTPGTDGYLPGETKPTVPTTTERPTTTTTTGGTPPTTGTQPPAPSTPPTTGSVPPNPGTMPPVPTV